MLSDSIIRQRNLVIKMRHMAFFFFESLIIYNQKECLNGFEFFAPQQKTGF